jgi:hypothetical protein
MTASYAVTEFGGANSSMKNELLEMNGDLRSAISDVDNSFVNRKSKCFNRESINF